MSESRKSGRKARPPMPAAARPRWVWPAAVALAALVAGGTFWWRARGQADPPGDVVPLAGTSAPPPAASGQGAPVFQRLKGRWERIDGGYVVEIRGVDPRGKVDAAYFNPRPIHVAKAEATLEGPSANLFIELRDQNYPGSTYTLRYDAARDVLHGTYYQALEQQTFDVLFARR